RHHAGSREGRAAEGLQRAVSFAVVVGRDGQGGRVDGQRAVDVADGVVAQARTRRGAGHNVVGAHRRRSRRPGAGLGHAVDGVTVSGSASGRGGGRAAEGLRRAVSFAVVVGRDGQGGRVDGRRAVDVAAGVV